MDARCPNDRRPARRTALGAAGALALLAGCTTGAGAEDTSPRGGADGSGTGLFDDAVVHDIEMSFDQDEYDAMIDALPGIRRERPVDPVVLLGRAPSRRRAPTPGLRRARR